MSIKSRFTEIWKLFQSRSLFWKIAAINILVLLVGYIGVFCYQNTIYLYDIARYNNVSFGKEAAFKVQDYTSVYMAITAFIGNGIQFFVMLFTLYILLVQMIEISNANQRYEQDKIDRQLEREEEKLKSERLLIQQERRHFDLMVMEKEKLRYEKIRREKSEIIDLIKITSKRIDDLVVYNSSTPIVGDLALQFFNNTLHCYLEALEKHRKFHDSYHGATFSNVVKFEKIIILCKTLINQAKGLEPESIRFFKELYEPAINARIIESTKSIRKIWNRAQDLQVTDESPVVGKTFLSIATYIDEYNVLYESV